MAFLHMWNLKIGEKIYINKRNRWQWRDTTVVLLISACFWGSVVEFKVRNACVLKLKKKQEKGTEWVQKFYNYFGKNRSEVPLSGMCKITVFWVQQRQNGNCVAWVNCIHFCEAVFKIFFSLFVLIISLSLVYPLQNDFLLNFHYVKSSATFHNLWIFVLPGNAQFFTWGSLTSACKFRCISWRPVNIPYIWIIYQAISWTLHMSEHITAVEIDGWLCICLYV